MKLNPVETVLVNNPFRGALLRSTLGWLYGAACGPAVERVLEVGCGQGDAVREVLARFRPRAIDAFDLDPAQVGRARGRLDDLGNGAHVRFWVGDAVVCYRCNAHYRGVVPRDAHRPYELVIGERYRQERIRREQLGTEISRPPRP